MPVKTCGGWHDWGAVHPSLQREQRSFVSPSSWFLLTLLLSMLRTLWKTFLMTELAEGHMWASLTRLSSYEMLLGPKQKVWDEEQFRFLSEERSSVLAAHFNLLLVWRLSTELCCSCRRGRREAEPPPWEEEAPQACVWMDSDGNRCCSSESGRMWWRGGSWIHQRLQESQKPSSCSFLDGGFSLLNSAAPLYNWSISSASLPQTDSPVTPQPQKPLMVLSLLVDSDSFWMWSTETSGFKPFLSTQIPNSSDPEIRKKKTFSELMGVGGWKAPVLTKAQ